MNYRGTEDAEQMGASLHPDSALSQHAAYASIEGAVARQDETQGESPSHDGASLCRKGAWQHIWC